MPAPTSPDPHGPARPRVRHRIGWIVFVVLGAIFCLAMGYWQLGRYRSATGTTQNLGYTFMWPFLAGFLVYTYLRYVRLEAEETEGADETGTARVADEVDDTATTVTAIPDDLLPRRVRTTPDPTEQDDTLRAYNDYLAALHRRDTGSAADQEDRSA